MSLGRKINDIIKKKNVTQKELADVAGVSQTFISFVLSDKKMPSVESLKRISDFLEISIDELLKETA